MKTFNQTQQTRKLSGFVIATLLVGLDFCQIQKQLAQRQTAVILVGTPRKDITRFLVLPLAHTTPRLGYFRS
jgi:hypothetical protein